MNKIQGNCKGDVKYSNRSDLSHFIFSILKQDDVLVTMGAGDITKVGPEVLAQLQHE